MASQIVCDGCMSLVDMGLAECPYCGRAFVNKNPAGTLAANTLLTERYTIGDCIALDGEGVTYKAIDNTGPHRVIIKEYVPVTICAARARDGSVIPRQGREVLFKTTRMDFIDLYRSLVRLGRTDGLVPVLDLVEANDTAYAVREPDEGESLLSYLEHRGAPLTQEEALLLLRPVVYGVEAMHRMGLLHRGISPETVFITPSGARLSGYATLGLRTAGSELKSQLSDGYAAPEQYSVAEFDGKYTDIYSLGALFYRAMTGHTPLPANLRRMNDTLPAAHTVNRELPGYVSAALGRAMRLVPEERMQSASDLLAALTTPSQHDTGFHLTQRQLKFLALAAAGLVLVGALSAWAILAGKKKKAAGSSASQSTSASSVAKQLTVPNFVGKQYKAVSSNSEYAKNYLFATEYEYSSTYKEGEIIRQNPAAGVVVESGTVITLTVSNGVQTAAVPPLTGLSLGDAKAALDALGIQYITIPYANSGGTYPANTVVQTEPAAGSTVKVGKDVVVLSIAAAPPASSSSSSSSSSSASSSAASSSKPASSSTPSSSTSSSSAPSSSAASSSGSTAPSGSNSGSQAGA